MVFEVALCFHVDALLRSDAEAAASDQRGLELMCISPLHLASFHFRHRDYFERAALFVGTYRDWHY
jgi:hypothetical protein